MWQATQKGMPGINCIEKVQKRPYSSAFGNLDAIITQMCAKPAKDFSFHSIYTQMYYAG